MNLPRCCIRTANAIAALALGLVGGCMARHPLELTTGSPQQRVDTVLYLYAGVRDTTADLEVYRLDFGQTLETIFQQFHQVNPRIHVVVQLYRESDLIRELASRNASGLGPDLLLVTNRTALQLARAGLTRSPQISADIREQLDAATLRRASLQNPPRLASLPVAQKAQLACFNTARLRQVPTTLQQLLAISAGGNAVGLSLDTQGLFWSAGALGASGALQQAISRGPLTTDQQQAVVRWTRWLRDAAAQQKVTFYGDQDLLIEALASGELDWISCHSTDLHRLRRRLGAWLGVSALPNGPGGEASPVNELTVLAMGINSSESQRRAAEAFAHFALNPLVQRNIAVSQREVLPVNRFVTVPAESSMVLRAMVRAQQQSRLTETTAAMIHLNDVRVQRTQELLTHLVFGERTPEATAAELIRNLQTQP